MNHIDPPTDTLATGPETRQEDTPDPGAVCEPAVPLSTVFERRKEWAAWLKSKALTQE